MGSPTKKALLLYWLTVLSGSALIGAPSWRELRSAITAGNFARLEGWVKQDGVESTSTANVLIAAAYAGNRTIIDRLLLLGIPVNGTNEYGVTPILKAADNGYTEVVQYLLQHGASANVIGRCDDFGCKGHTPLMGAACKKDLDMAKMLLQAGADPRTADDAATEMANSNGDVELYLLLRQFGGRERQTNASPQLPIAQGSIPIAALGLTELLPGKPRTGSIETNKSKARLAIVADEHNVIPADLLTTRLSAGSSLELVERQELDRVLSEQKLTRHFSTETANYGRVAELLRADALLLIRGREVAGRKVVETRLLRVNPGLVLDTVYSPAPISEPADWAERMGGRVTGLTAKVSGQGAIALALLSISSSVNNVADRELDRTLAVMLNDRLSHQPHFILLERADMDRMTSENVGRFLTGSYLVDGNVESTLDGSGAFKFSIRFKPAGSGEAMTFTATGRRANPSQAIDDLLAQVNGRLSKSPRPQPRDLAEEAQLYLEEANWALATDQAALAQSAAEAAWALGSRSIELARLRVLAAMLTVRDLHHLPAGKQDHLGPAGWLDLVTHGLHVWRETLDGDLLRGKPEEIRKWLEFGFDSVDGALFAAFQIRMAGEQVRQAARLQKLREMCWEILEAARRQSRALPNGENFDNRASEKQGVLARFLFPNASELLPVVRDLLSRRFATNNAQTRASIRASLVHYWDGVVIPFRYRRTPLGSLSLPFSRGDEACRQVADSIRESPAAEDRYIAALLALKRAAFRGTVTQPEIDRLCSTLFDLRDSLAEGGELFGHYFDLFDSLDQLKGVPFFSLTRHESGNRMWERHTPEHSRFRGKLFTAVVSKAKKSDAQFNRMINRDDFTPDQEKEIATARATLAALTPLSPRTAKPAGASRAGMMSSAGVPTPNLGSPAAVDGVPPLRVHRLWHPFNLGLGIPAEFRAGPNMQSAEGRIWVHGCTIDRGGQCDRHFLFGIDADTLRTETFALPEPSSGPDARFVITESHLLVNLRGQFAVFDRAKARWDVYKEIKPVELSSPLVIREHVYLSVVESPGNALIDFDLKSRMTEILASPRRRPALGPFDDPGLPITAVRTNEVNELVVSSGKTSHAWSPAGGRWRPFQPGPTSNLAADGPRYGRVGTIRAENDIHVLRLTRKTGPTIDIPLAYRLPPGTDLPGSRYHWRLRYGQNIWPTHCNSFAGGLLLTPNFHPSGFWIVPHKEIEEYLRQRDAMPRSIESAAKSTP